MIDDDKVLCDHAREWFEADNHAFECVYTGREGLERLTYFQYDVSVIDLGLPDMDGGDIIAKYRWQGGLCPIIVLTGQSDLERKESALDSGADDYLVKPFHLRELSARIRALLRRPPAITRTVLQIADLQLDPTTKRVNRGGLEVELLPREFALLEFLMRHAEQFFSSDILLERVWVAESETSPDVIRVYVNRLRSKIDLPGRQPLIQTQRGYGYRITSAIDKAREIK